MVRKYQEESREVIDGKKEIIKIMREMALEDIHKNCISKQKVMDVIGSLYYATKEQIEKRKDSKDNSEMIAAEVGYAYIELLDRIIEKLNLEEIKDSSSAQKRTGDK